MSINLQVYKNQIRIPVTKRLSKKDMKSVIEDFQTKKLTFAVSKIGTEFELWREVLSDDKFMEKTDNNIIIYSKNIKITDNLLNSRKFICIWKRGKIVYGEF